MPTSTQDTKLRTWTDTPTNDYEALLLYVNSLTEDQLWSIVNKHKKAGNTHTGNEFMFQVTARLHKFGWC